MQKSRQKDNVCRVVTGGWCKYLLATYFLFYLLTSVRHHDRYLAPPARRVGAIYLWRDTRHVGMMKVTVLTRGHSCEAAGLHSVRTERFCRRIAREQAGGDELRWYGSGYNDLPRECVPE